MHWLLQLSLTLCIFSATTSTSTYNMRVNKNNFSRVTKWLEKDANVFVSFDLQCAKKDTVSPVPIRVVVAPVNCPVDMSDIATFNWYYSDPDMMDVEYEIYQEDVDCGTKQFNLTKQMTLNGNNQPVISVTHDGQFIIIFGAIFRDDASEAHLTVELDQSSFVQCFYKVGLKLNKDLIALIKDNQLSLFDIRVGMDVHYGFAQGSYPTGSLVDWCVNHRQPRMRFNNITFYI